MTMNMNPDLHPDRVDCTSPRAGAVAPTLSERLRLETRDAHMAAERSGIMPSLLRGSISRESYVSLLESLQLVYAALEEELARHATHPSLAFIDLSVLARTERLARDIAVLRAGLAAKAPVARPAAHAYATSIREAGRTAPELLLAHAYLRYLGDLSGGRILERIVGKALGRTGGDGLEFYAFPAITDAAAFKQRFRDGVDAVDLDEPGRDAIVGEALRGFAGHREMFAELV